MRFGKKLTVIVVAGLVAVAIGTFSMMGRADASGGGEPLKQPEWHFSGPFGTYDQAALQRGYKVYREVCSACHSMKRVAFRNLSALGYDEGQIKTIASEYTYTDGPDDEGEMFERPGLGSDYFPSPFPNKKAAEYANSGAFPPDLSLMTKARKNGPDYVYSLLTGYGEPAHGVVVPSGKHYNKFMAGHVIAMAPPLSDDLVSYEDGTAMTMDQYARDVVEFLTWAADPYMNERKEMGFKVLMFLFVFSGVMYAYKKKIWADLH